jgi:hypothetical protein
LNIVTSRQAAGDHYVYGSLNQGRRYGLSVLLGQLLFLVIDSVEGGVAIQPDTQALKVLRRQINVFCV